MISRMLVLWFAFGFLFLFAGCRRQEAHSKRTPPSSGKEVYEMNCAACHGSNGDGNGPASVWLFPKPRDFSAGMFKIQSTPPGALPTDEDLFNSVTRGLPGSSMPSFNYLSEQERRLVVQYIKTLTGPVDASGKHANLFEQAKLNNRKADPIHVPPEPPATIQALDRGKKLFKDLGCVRCHGDTGTGDGPSAPTLKDNWGYPLPPRDFNTGAFRGGPAGKDLYTRIATGLAGTPMPAFGNDLVSEDDRWAVVHYIQSLRRKDIEVNDMLAPPDGTILVQKVKRLPLSPVDPEWEPLETARVQLNPLWPEADPIPAVAIRAVHDGRRIAILLQWRDSIADGAPIRIQDFQDAVAVQFSINGTTPFLGMGDAANPVNIWQWKAGWQQDLDTGRADMNSAYPSIHSDVYPETKPLFRTAEAAGNVLAQPEHASPVEDANAHGFGTMKSQPLKEQNVKGKGIWQDGHWNVLLVRELKSGDADDVRFSKDQPIPVAFAVWDGQNRDRNGRKVISNWHRLVLEP